VVYIAYGKQVNWDADISVIKFCDANDMNFCQCKNMEGGREVGFMWDLWPDKA